MSRTPFTARSNCPGGLARGPLSIETLIFPPLACSTESAKARAVLVQWCTGGNQFANFSVISWADVGTDAIIVPIATAPLKK